VIREGAHVERAVIDDAVEIGRGARVGEAGGEIALVGLRATVADEASVPAGGRYPEDED
jgi:ADP-glucose pyrophosphorylase